MCFAFKISGAATAADLGRHGQRRQLPLPLQPLNRRHLPLHLLGRRVLLLRCGLRRCGEHSRRLLCPLPLLPLLHGVDGQPPRRRRHHVGRRLAWTHTHGTRLVGRSVLLCKPVGRRTAHASCRPQQCGRAEQSLPSLPCAWRPHRTCPSAPATSRGSPTPTCDTASGGGVQHQTGKEAFRACVSVWVSTSNGCLSLSLSLVSFKKKIKK